MECLLAPTGRVSGQRSGATGSSLATSWARLQVRGAVRVGPFRDRCLPRRWHVDVRIRFTEQLQESNAQTRGVEAAFRL